MGTYMFVNRMYACLRIWEGGWELQFREHMAQDIWPYYWLLVVVLMDNLSDKQKFM